MTCDYFCVFFIHDFYYSFSIFWISLVRGLYTLLVFFKELTFSFGSWKMLIIVIRERKRVYYRTLTTRLYAEEN